MATFFEHETPSYKRRYLKNLVILALSDGSLDKEERELIFNIGYANGLNETQITPLLESHKKEEMFLPETAANQMALLYDLMRVIYADGHTKPEEINCLKEFIISFNLRPEIVDHLIDLFQYEAPSTKEWKDFVEYIKEVFVS